ncbi:PAP/OAS1 substrate-binding domain-containing protein [Patellaria atrata CBS 101060]|uniref:polynucleotide adenylyltransferase n=1 Tax=Patellaria atrata CBS 101060 TaxID=1346257 RepID=A0A9P4SJB9_9PEZI|nr:PAP/OAS1 substrate-binding domain-containing protein [Patellaria atrata CBS 101060]
MANPGSQQPRLEDQLRNMILGNSAMNNLNHQSPNRNTNAPVHQGHAQRPVPSRQSVGNNRSTQHQSVDRTTTTRSSTGQRGRPQPPGNRPPQRNRKVIQNSNSMQPRQTNAKKPAQNNLVQGSTPTSLTSGPQVRTLQRPQSHPQSSPNPQRRLPPKPPGSFQNQGASQNGATPKPQRPFNQNTPRQILNTTPQISNIERFSSQCRHLDDLLSAEVPNIRMTPTELAEKEAFRAKLETICQKAMMEAGHPLVENVLLKAFGSFSSGFATRRSDMDLVIIPLPAGAPIDQEIPRLFEKAFLKLGYGARLLMRTRVPILKICERPTPELLKALYKESQKDETTTSPDGNNPLAEEELSPITQEDPSRPEVQLSNMPDALRTMNQQTSAGIKFGTGPGNSNSHTTPHSALIPVQNGDDGCSSKGTTHAQPPKSFKVQKGWLREKKLGPLDFPKDGVGIQCDLNFSNDLALHNTLLLRCYSHCDPRVTPMVLFVKAWAKRRKINHSYSGTLSSYGWVLMVLHFLMNVVKPAVLPNLQLLWRPHPQETPTEVIARETSCNGYNVCFMRNEDELIRLAAQRSITTNVEPLGVLLRNFFQYFTHQGPNVIGGGFRWSADVLSLRTPGGLRTKQEKGWTGAMTTVVDDKEVRHRYLLAIEDPFELDHNVARTVTHPGIVAIRDEFRRTWRILEAVGNRRIPEGAIFEELNLDEPKPVAGTNPQSSELGNTSTSASIPPVNITSNQDA